jgi:hypothetical protein
MKKYILFLFLCLVGINLIASPGDTISLQSHTNVLIRTNPNVGSTTYKNWVVFPDASIDIHKVLMKLSFKCPSGENCGEWDYLNYIYLRRKGSVNNPSQDIELARYITPYGNTFNSVWSAEWEQDITDFEGLLKDSIEIDYVHTGYETNVGRGWVINLSFQLIEGTPIRPYRDIHKLWNSSFIYGNANTPFNTLVEPKEIQLGASTESMRMRIMQSGHGAEPLELCSEFCPKMRTLSRNGEAYSNELVWRDNCGLNPNYPQGGTWIYDRGNWCPGDLVYPSQYDMSTSASSTQTFSMSMEDFVSTSNGNYMIESYLIEYGAPSFQTDASIEDILAPSTKYYFKRFNPICGRPKILIRNNGVQALTSAQIEYGPAGGIKSSYSWNGNLAFMQSVEVELPANVIWGSSSGIFEAELKSVNGISDEYSLNDRYQSSFIAPYVAQEQFVVNLLTNTMPQENSWRITDQSGNVLYSGDNFEANTEYRDTVSLPEGCYEFIIEDSGKDGLSFWANEAGTGFIRFRRLGNNSILKSFNADFGTRVTFPFTTGSTLGIEAFAENEPVMQIFPNPSVGNSQLNIELNTPEDVQVQVFNSAGQVLVQLNPEKKSAHLLEMPDLVPGFYLVRVVAGTYEKTLRWLVVK